MAIINTNFDEVPDQQEAIATGIYLFRITRADLQPTKDKQSTNLELDMKVESDGLYKDKPQRDWCSVKAPTKIKRVAKSAGVAVGANGLDTNDLKDKVVCAVVKKKVITDDETKRQREVSNIEEYLIPGDEGFIGA